MTITAALVLWSIIWFMTFFVILPIRIETQGDKGEIVPGTHAGSPETHHLKKKAWITTGITVVLFVISYVVITSGWISVRDLDWFGRMSPPR
ncbi:DUF1467 family protein [Chachezhania sediminis]|uniref:DUF1467 family protein n=1 Tax=Chachezhania sediminis TaxID=2599291 RepID=UPI00131E2BED|nr:DUF1467 family protein [Chachezhania sediminis]